MELGILKNSTAYGISDILVKMGKTRYNGLSRRERKYTRGYIQYYS